MADKFRTTFTIPVTFAAGEQPTSTKLNSISTQSRNGLALLEKAIGDLWNQSGDATSSAFPNRISNIARALGDQALLTSKIPLPNFSGTTSVRIRQPIANFFGKSEIILSFKPENDATLTASMQLLKNQSAAFYTGSSTLTRNLVDTDTEWFADLNNAKIYLGMSLSGTQTTTYIEYNVSAVNFSLGSDSANSSSFSMIPTQTQSDWKGLKIAQIASNQYHIVLPFRRPDAAPAGVSKLPLDFNNSAEVASPSVIRYWGPAASGYVFNSTISSNKFYRYTLPPVVVGMYASPVPSTVIPTGTMYLWDTQTNTVIDGVTFRIPAVTPSLGGIVGQRPFILQADGVSLDQVFNGPNGDFRSSMTTDLPADYKSRFALICVGQSLANAVSELRRDLTEGDAAIGPRKRPSHRDLADTQPARDANRHPIVIPGAYLDGDDHSHLLSRLGSADTATVGSHRDRYNNGILGDLLLLSTNSGTNYQNLTTFSNSIYFGSKSASSPRLRSFPQSFGAAPAGTARNIIEVKNASLQVDNGIIHVNDGTIMMPNNRDFAVFDDGGDLTGKLWGSRVLLNATTQQLATFNGTLNGTRYIDIDATSLNRIKFLGADLDISAVSGTRFVRIGLLNPLTSLRLDSNKLYWGPLGSDDHIVFDDATNTWAFIENSSVNNSIIAAGTLRATNTVIEFGGTAAVASTNSLIYTSGTKTYSFFADGVFTSVVEAGKLRSVNYEVELGPAGEYDIFVDTASDEIRLRHNGSTNVSTLVKSGKFRADNSASDAIKSDGGIVAAQDIVSTSGNIQGDSFIRNSSQSAKANVPIIPSYWSEDGSWQQLNDLPAGGAQGPMFSWLLGASYNKTEILWFVIPFIPRGATITSIRVAGSFQDGGGGANTKFYAALGTEDSSFVTSAALSAALGGTGYVSRFITIPSGGYTYTGGELSVILGLKNESGSTGINGYFRFTCISVSYSYTEIKF